MSEPEIFELHERDAESLATLLRAAREPYIHHFHPFPFSAEEIRRRLAARRDDRWWGVRADAQLAGFFMLRGWDEGFGQPAFGVFVDEAWAGRGFARRALAWSLEYCRARHTPAVMLTVHPENTRARRAYKAAGFVPDGVNPATGHLLYRLLLT